MYMHIYIYIYSLCNKINTKRVINDISVTKIKAKLVIFY